MPIPSLSAKEALILVLLEERGALYGLELVAASAGGLKRGTVYVTLDRMIEKGYVSADDGVAPAGGGLPRRRYRATALGRRALTAARHAAAIMHGRRVGYGR